jgi:PPOX class probable F420-dependent enzyme
MATKTTKLEAKARRLIRREVVVWLTTVGPGHSPQPRPVWFVWDRGTFLIFSPPQAFKVRHIRRNPSVALHFNTDPSGDGDVIVYSGTAHIDPQAPPAHRVASYFRKYRQGIQDLGMSPEGFSSEYSTAIRIKPTSLRGW